jgi:ABC-type molybdate transport system substrate-binding protein
MFKTITISLTGLVLALGSIATSASAGEIKVFALQSPQIAIRDLAADFEHKTGYKIVDLSRTTELPAAVKTRIDAGESFDVALLTTPVLDQLIREGKLIADTRTNSCRFQLAWPTGTAPPSLISALCRHSSGRFSMPNRSRTSRGQLWAISGGAIRSLGNWCGAATKIEAARHRGCW